MPCKDKTELKKYHKQYYKKNRVRLLEKQKKYIEGKDKGSRSVCNYSLKIKRGKFIVYFD